MEAQTHAFASEGVPPRQATMPRAPGAVASLPPGLSARSSAPPSLGGGGGADASVSRGRLGGRLAARASESSEDLELSAKGEPVDLAAVAALSAAPTLNRSNPRASAEMALLSLREPEPAGELREGGGKPAPPAPTPAQPKPRGVSFNMPEPQPEPEPEPSLVPDPRTPPGRSTGIAEASEREAARAWLKGQGFTDAEAEEFEAFRSDTEEFSVAALQEVGVPRLRQLLRKRAGVPATPPLVNCAPLSGLHRPLRTVIVFGLSFASCGACL